MKRCSGGNLYTGRNENVTRGMIGSREQREPARRELDYRALTAIRLVIGIAAAAGIRTEVGRK